MFGFNTFNSFAKKEGSALNFEKSLIGIHTFSSFAPNDPRLTGKL